MTEEKLTYHLWGVRLQYRENNENFNTIVAYPLWEYIKESSPDRRSLNGIDRRKWSQLELRDSEGHTIENYDTTLEE